MWSPFYEKPLKKFTGHKGSITALSTGVSLFDCDELNLYSGSLDQTVKQWSTSGECLRTIDMGSGIKSLVVNDFGRLLVVGLESGEIVV
mmetsp:Transcript_22209/g.18516  ORF Transcript_22209/g.18516 Transcript_22209/m.18516 type:complete len:89 (-) Transcript_22209:259-525(-)